LRRLGGVSEPLSLSKGEREPPAEILSTGFARGAERRLLPLQNFLVGIQRDFFRLHG
jgi:hypothetical protein